MAARNEQRAKEAIARLDFNESELSKKASVEWLELDLSDPKKVKEAAEKFLEKETRLDILGGQFSCRFSLSCADHLR